MMTMFGTTIRNFLVATLFLHAATDNSARVGVVQALPTGAAGCEGDMSAVMGPHLGGGATSSPLPTGNLTLTIDGQNIPPGAIVSMEIDGQYDIGVVWEGEAGTAPFKGVLLRGEGAGIGSVLITPKMGDTELQNADACVAPAVGITHTNPEAKTSVEGTIQYVLPAPAVVADVFGATLDVTVVVETTTHFYSGYTMNFLTSIGDDPTAAPTEECQSIGKYYRRKHGRLHLLRPRMAKETLTGVDESTHGD